MLIKDINKIYFDHCCKMQCFVPCDQHIFRIIICSILLSSPSILREKKHLIPIHMVKTMSYEVSHLGFQIEKKKT
jgi:hypothetical protein